VGWIDRTSRRLRVIFPTANVVRDDPSVPP
jgi:hypothetical protein